MGVDLSAKSISWRVIGADGERTARVERVRSRARESALGHLAEFTRRIIVPTGTGQPRRATSGSRESWRQVGRRGPASTG